MPTKEMDRQETRIPESLQKDIRDRKMSSESNFLFVKELNDVDDKTVEVIFETPFAERVLSQKFYMPDSDGSQADNTNTTHPPLSDLYSAVGADITKPNSILSVSIPRDIDCLHFTDNNTDDSWNMNLYKKEESSRLEKLGAGLFTTIGFISAAVIFSGTFLSSVVALIVLFTGILISFSIVMKEYTVPESASPIYSPLEITNGDIIILDEDHVSNKDEREICRVISTEDAGIEGMLRDGQTVGISYDNSKNEWVIYDYENGAPTVDSGYESAYLIEDDTDV